MLTMRRESLVRCAAAVVAIGGHVLLIVLLSRSHPRPFNDSASRVPIRGTLVVLELRPLPEPTAAGPAEPARALVTPRVRVGSPPLLDTRIEALPVKPSVDWYREAEIRIPLGPGAEAVWHRRWYPRRSIGSLRRGADRLRLRNWQDRCKWRAVQGHEASGPPDELRTGPRRRRSMTRTGDFRIRLRNPKR
jgi:hypothetical protein